MRRTTEASGAHRASSSTDTVRAAVSTASRMGGDGRSPGRSRAGVGEGEHHLVRSVAHTPVRLLAKAEPGLPARERLLRPLATGELLGGIAYAHVRSASRVQVCATDERGGPRFDGPVPWCAGWSLNDVMLLAAARTTSSSMPRPGSPGTARLPGRRPGNVFWYLKCW
ncbi:hypothetical protein [Streptomyces sp. NPDC058812]|uniref:hypothetical protein n=1 Tax=unclassified Streptomyces TaxID=2593676 RepID=UPI0036A6040A